MPGTLKVIAEAQVDRRGGTTKIKVGRILDLHASYQLLKSFVLKEFATQHGISHFVTSAKCGTGIEELFFYIARTLKNR